jgi:hypothetical protein
MSNYCTKCAKDPTAHSFHHLGQVGGVQVFYTDAGAATDPDVDRDIENLMAHLEQVRGRPWIWFFNCRKMSGGSPSHSIALLKRIQAEHEQWIQKLYIIHPNTWFTWIFNILRPFAKSTLLDRLEVVKEEGLALYIYIKKLGLEHNIARSLM